MAKDLKIEGNYLYITDTLTGDVTDKTACLIEIRKKYSTSTEFTVFYNDGVVVGLCNLIWSDFTLEGVAFADQDAFEDWKNTNTGRC